MKQRTWGLFSFQLNLIIGAAGLVFAALLTSCAEADDETQKQGATPPAATAEAPSAVKKTAPLANSTKPPASGDKVVTADVPEPADYRTNHYRTPVPATLKGARVIEGEEAQEIYKKKSAIFIDVYPRAPKPANLPKNTVWRDTPHMSIKGTHWLPNVGYGVIPSKVEAYFKSNLERLTGGDKAKPIVFFCLKDCWMSWNAGKRAIEWGYTSVIWFSDGTDGWQEAGGSLTRIQAVK